MPKHLYAQMTWEEVNEAVLARRVVLIPVAAIEQHGYHLPIDMDNLAVEAVCNEAAQRAPDLLLSIPPIHYGYNEHNMDFPGTVSVSMEHFLGYCYDVGASMARQGFERIVFVNGHGSNAMLLNLTARKLTMETDAAVAALSHWSLAKPEVDRLRESEYPGGMAHACELETALYLHLRPELVKMDRIVDEYERRSIPQGWSDLFGEGPVHFVDHYSRNSVSGVAGAATLASAEKGRAFFECEVEALIQVGRDFRVLERRPRHEYKVRPL
jgi:creatinine amidohydrolase